MSEARRSVCAAPRTGLALAALLLAVAGPACLSQERLTPRRFVPLVERPAVSDEVGQGTLRLGQVRVSPLFERSPFVVRTGETTWTEDHYHGFFGAPAVLLRESLADWLGGAGIYGQVVGQEHRGAVDRVLDLDVSALYLDLRDPAAPAAVFEVGYRLYDQEAIVGIERLRGESSVSEPATGQDADALVEAWSRAWGTAFGRLEEQLRMGESGQAALGP